MINILPVAIDIIILSYAKNEELKQLTKQTIRTLLGSEDPEKIQFNILVLESEKKLSPFQFENTTTIYPEESFGFNTYLNIGVRNTKNRLICFCNNDLIFHKEWASEILKAIDNNPTIMSASPFCPIFHSNLPNGITDDVTFGYKNGELFTGWCFLVKRQLINAIGPFDEKFKFWYCDDDFRNTIEKCGFQNALIKNSKVTHIGSNTLHSLNQNTKTNLQYSSFAYYKYKWVHHNLAIYIFETLKYKIKIALRSK